MPSEPKPKKPLSLGRGTLELAQDYKETSLIGVEDRIRHNELNYL